MDSGGEVCLGPEEGREVNQVRDEASTTDELLFSCPA